MYFPLALDMYSGLFIDTIGFMTVYAIKKRILVLTQSNILTLALMSELRAVVSIFDFVGALDP